MLIKGRTKEVPPKAAELIIYIASRLHDKPTYGLTLLGKAVCLIDSTSYVKTGKPITNFTYIKQEFGPTPDAQFLAVRDMLVQNGELQSKQVSYFGYLQTRYVAMREPNVEVFEKDEIALINDVLDKIAHMTASDLSEYTHQLVAWQAAEPMEELPLHSFLMTHREPTEADIVWAKGKITAI